MRACALLEKYIARETAEKESVFTMDGDSKAKLLWGRGCHKEADVRGGWEELRIKEKRKAKMERGRKRGLLRKR